MKRVVMWGLLFLLAGFEGDSYGDWEASGEAFGDGPARGTLPGQMEVTGYRGQGLVNSFRGGDDTIGTLTSPPFTIERDHINFLIGGGGYSGETCVNLLIDGEVVRTATGPNREAGGRERLRWDSWDVSELAGQEARIRIVDQRQGGWGHINVDHIVFSDEDIKDRMPALRRTITVEKRYLHLPIDREAPRRRLRFTVDGRTQREFDIRLAPAALESRAGDTDTGPASSSMTGSRTSGSFRICRNSRGGS